MTFLGRKDKQDQIDDVTEEAEDKQLAWAAASVEELKSQFDYSKLDTEAKNFVRLMDLSVRTKP